jgi:hypothetical protein
MAQAALRVQWIYGVPLTEELNTITGKKMLYNLVQASPGWAAGRTTDLAAPPQSIAVHSPNAGPDPTGRLPGFSTTRLPVLAVYSVATVFMAAAALYEVMDTTIQ